MWIGPSPRELDAFADRRPAAPQNLSDPLGFRERLWNAHVVPSGPPRAAPAGLLRPMASCADCVLVQRQDGNAGRITFHPTTRRFLRSCAVPVVGKASPGR